MEWLPSFCFICGVLGFGGFLRSGSQDLSDWWKGVLEKHGIACQGGSEEERREEDTGFQISAVVSPVSLGTEKGSSSIMLAVVCSLSPAPSFVEHSSVSQWSSEAKNRFWAFKCFLLWPKYFPARIPQVISLLLMSPPLEPKKRDPKHVNMQT
nr:hypothetical protein CFP56_50002 [Quercus suber]